MTCITFYCVLVYLCVGYSNLITTLGLSSKLHAPKKTVFFMIHWSLLCVGMALSVLEAVVHVLQPCQQLCDVTNVRHLCYQANICWGWWERDSFCRFLDEWKFWVELAIKHKQLVLHQSISRLIVFVDETCVVYPLKPKVNWIVKLITLERHSVQTHSTHSSPLSSFTGTCTS